MRLRKVMKGAKITKAAGYSFIEKGGQIHKFIVKDKSHPQSQDIHTLLNGFYTEVKLLRITIYCQSDNEEMQLFNWSKLVISA